MPLTDEEQLRADLDALVKRVKSLEVALNVVVLSGVAGAFAPGRTVTPTGDPDAPEGVPCPSASS